MPWIWSLFCCSRDIVSKTKGYNLSLFRQNIIIYLQKWNKNISAILYILNIGILCKCFFIHDKWIIIFSYIGKIGMFWFIIHVFDSPAGQYTAYIWHFNNFPLSFCHKDNLLKPECQQNIGLKEHVGQP